jgi:hypothetical protein
MPAIRKRPRPFKGVFQKATKLKVYKSHPTREPLEPAPPNETHENRIQREARNRKRQIHYRPGSMPEFEVTNV